MLKTVSGYFLAVFALLVGLMAQAQAALDPAISTAITGIGADATALGALVFPVILSVLAMTIGWKLFKRLTNKV